MGETLSKIAFKKGARAPGSECYCYQDDNITVFLGTPFLAYKEHPTEWNLLAPLGMSFGSTLDALRGFYESQVPEEFEGVKREALLYVTEDIRQVQEKLYLQTGPLLRQGEDTALAELMNRIEKEYLQK